MCQGVTKSGSPTPREMTPFWLWTMSKNSRIPERGMSRTFFATNDSGLNGAAIVLRMRARTPRVPRDSQKLSGGLVLPATDDRLGLIDDDRAGNLHRDNVIGARDLIHNIEHDFLEDASKSTRSSAFANGEG